MQSYKSLRFGLLARDFGRTVQNSNTRQAVSIRSCACLLNTTRGPSLREQKHIDKRKWYSTSSGDDEFSRLNKDQRKAVDRLTGKKKSNFEMEVLSGKQLEPSGSSSDSDGDIRLTRDEVIEGVSLQEPATYTYLHGAGYRGDKQNLVSIMSFLREKDLLDESDGTNSLYEDIAWTPEVLKEYVGVGGTAFVKYLLDEGYEGDPQDVKSVTDYFRRANLLESTLKDKDVFTESYVRQLLEEGNKDLTDYLSKKGYTGQVRHSNRVVDFMRSKELIVPSDDELEETTTQYDDIEAEERKHLMTPGQLLDNMGDPDFERYLKENLQFEGDVEDLEQVAEFLHGEYNALVLSPDEDSDIAYEESDKDEIDQGIDPKTFFEDKHDMWTEEFPAVCLICRAVGDHMTFDCPQPTLQDYLERDHSDLVHDLPTVLDAADYSRRTRASRYLSEPPAGVYLGGVPERAPYKMLDSADDGSDEDAVKSDPEWEKMTSPEYFNDDNNADNRSSSDYTASESDDEVVVEMDQSDFENLSDAPEAGAHFSESSQDNSGETTDEIYETDTDADGDADVYAEDTAEVTQQAADEHLDVSAATESSESGAEGTETLEDSSEGAVDSDDEAYMGVEGEDARGGEPGAGPTEAAVDEQGWGAKVPSDSDEYEISGEESMDEKEARNRLDFAIKQRDEYITYLDWLTKGGDVTQIIDPSVKRHYLQSLRETAEVPLRKKTTTTADERKRAMAASFDL